MSEQKTHWKKIANKEFLGAHDLNTNEDRTVVINFIVRREITGEGGRTEEATVMNIKGQKPMILNVTNQKTLTKLYGPYIEDWAGKSITLYGSTTSLKGDQVECLRIRPVVPSDKKRTLNEDRFNKSLVSIEAGEFTVEKLLKTYDLTEDQLKRLPKQIEAPVVATDQV